MRARYRLMGKFVKILRVSSCLEIGVRRAGVLVTKIKLRTAENTGCMYTSLLSWYKFLLSFVGFNLPFMGLSYHDFFSKGAV